MENETQRCISFSEADTDTFKSPGLGIGVCCIVVQWYARKNRTAMDTISTFMQVVAEEAWAGEAPMNGCYFSGLWMENACMDRKSMTLADSRPNEIWSKMCTVWLTTPPKLSSDYVQKLLPVATDTPIGSACVEFEVFLFIQCMVARKFPFGFGIVWRREYMATWHWQTHESSGVCCWNPLLMCTRIVAQNWQGLEDRTRQAWGYFLPHFLWYACACYWRCVHTCRVLLVHWYMQGVDIVSILLWYLVRHTGTFSCPIYRTSARATDVYTQMSNFVVSIDLQPGERTVQHWISRGVLIVSSILDWWKYQQPSGFQCTAAGFATCSECSEFWIWYCEHILSIDWNYNSIRTYAC